ncbi:MAG: helix-turn-helix transcriptional regulator [Chloroflexota bacterium]|nr:helix-turn-helix transcriptional regulator [Chloroflexota bacterium]
MKKAGNITPNLRLKAAREARGWSQKYVADQIDADHYYLSRCERGTAFPSPHYRSKLCVLFGADARQIDHREQMCLILKSLGAMAGERGDYAQAEVYLQEGLALARQIGYKERIGLLLVNLGWIVSAMGRYEQADRCMQEALEVAQQSGNQAHQRHSRRARGKLPDAAAQGDMVEARRLGEESADILEKIGHLTAPEIKQWLAQDVLNA